MLFEPLSIRGKRARNRVVMPPMATNFGIVSRRGIAWYAARSRGGVGTVIVEGTGVDQLCGPAHASRLAGLADAIHEGGALAVIQLTHWQKLETGEVVAISAAGDELGTADRRVISDEEILRIAQKFREASVLARQAGLDGAEIHGAHGYFFNRFFSPRFNTRSGRFGGSLEGRMQLGLECVRAVRSVGPDFLVFYRHTPEEEAGPDSGGAVASAYVLDESVAFAKALVKAGADVIDVSPSSRANAGAATDQLHGGHAGLAGAIRKALTEHANASDQGAAAGAPGVTRPAVVAVGGMEDPDAAERALASGKADLVAVGRALIADACWTEKVRTGRRGDIIPCRKCDEKCYGNLDKGLPIGCSSNPASGWEFQG